MVSKLKRKLKKKRPAPTHFKLCRMVRIKSKAGRIHINKLHRSQGSRGHVKLPGIRKRYILHQGLRRAARKGKHMRSKILRGMNAMKKRNRRVRHIGGFSSIIARKHHPMPLGGIV